VTITRPIKTVDELANAGLIADRDRDREALDAVAARYAIAVTPDVARLIDHDNPKIPKIRSRASSCPMPPSS